VFPELRERSAGQLTELDFAGYSIGGLAVGEGQRSMLEVLDTTTPQLPDHKPRYLMGVGTPLDLVESVARGVDMFDCVMPTRAGRHGTAYTWNGKLNIKNAKFAEDPEPLDHESACPAARDYSKAYLHHLIRSGEYLGAMLLTWANVQFYQDLMAAMRLAIAEGRFQQFRKDAQRRFG
jgi:queuine tRNA-ribosyltransferase